MGRKCPAPKAVKCASQVLAQSFARRVDGIGIDDQHLVPHKGFAWHQHGFGDERGIERIVRERIAHGLDHGRVVRLAGADSADQRIEHELLHGLITPERIVVMRGQECKVGRVAIGFDDDRRGKAAIDREDRRLGEPRHANFRLRIGQHLKPLPVMGGALAVEPRQPQRDRHRQLSGLTRRVGYRLFERQDGLSRRRIVVDPDLHARRSGL